MDFEKNNIYRALMSEPVRYLDAFKSQQAKSLNLFTFCKHSLPRAALLLFWILALCFFAGRFQQGAIGREVLKENLWVGNGTKQVLIPNSSSGIYWCKVVQNGKVLFLEKIVVVH